LNTPTHTMTPSANIHNYYRLNPSI
jgi:hypothetical protein